MLRLLNTEGIEPVIRRSAVTQISVMLEDPFLHKPFIESNGLDVIVYIMKSALTDNDYKDYVDCVVPAISILKSLCLYNSVARQLLSTNFDVYFCTLRGDY